jgi:hypothetical protein
MPQMIPITQAGIIKRKNLDFKYSANDLDVVGDPNVRPESKKNNGIWKA